MALAVRASAALFSADQLFNLRQVGLPRIAFAGGAYVVRRALLLDEDHRVEVFDGGIAPLHVGDGQLSGDAGMKRALRLHLAQFLRLGGIQEIELLDFGIGTVRHIKLAGKQR